MAPRKGKAEVSVSKVVDDDTLIILGYLREQNRPYSATDICLNLHNKVSKGQATKILQKLHQNGEIAGKVAGKQVVYHTLQKVSDDTNTHSIHKITTEIKTLQEELSLIKAEEKTARSSLSTLKSKPRISELHLDIQRLEKEQMDLQSKLTKSTASSDTIKLSPEQRATLESEWKYWQRQATLRRRICRDLWGRCSEVLPENITASELWESLGLEGVI
ncbi:hypothetical protein PENSTE_c002G06050 [Penicillium steckii]|uniref:Homologous-pairing protein 2 winged helix domain-containing protein n=1 Tax=Penicillium steckii TaxID=303698 RepID=A0A1V6TTS3_9EURO|nr:hypothetical protein PENSTE_c002G06050 [Penicillium steckii]